MTDSQHHAISPALLNLKQIASILRENRKLEISEVAARRIQECREYLDLKLTHPHELFYGINTGFGSLCNIKISGDEIENLQMNLLMSHAAGTGDTVPPEIVRIMLLLKIQSLSYGNSGVRLEVVQRLADFFNEGIFPVVFELGSLGASGDLAPLAHLSLPLAGMGEVWHEGRRQRADVVLKLKGWQPLIFKAKEALALLNGTQFSAAYSVWLLLESKRLAKLADFNAAAAADGFNCRLAPFDKRIQEIRPHEGQILVAKKIRKLLKTSEIAKSEKTSVQDPYAFRCVPQVHGASRDALDYVEKTVVTEINSVTDNPLIFPSDDAILSGGNFHAQPLALALDFAAIALSELGNISERRVYQLISGQRGLPPFLTPDPGLHSGFMIAQYTAAAIVNQNKTLCSPASVDSIVSCNGQEDHVSMAANAATKARRVALNLERLLAIEFMVAMQAVSLRRPLKSGKKIGATLEIYRETVPELTVDRILSIDIENTIQFLRSHKI